jgi:hypothetical protein
MIFFGVDMPRFFRISPRPSGDRSPVHRAEKADPLAISIG